MISIGGVVLDSDVRVEGQNNSEATVNEVLNTIGGAAYIVNHVRVPIVTVTFVSDEDFGWQKYNTVQALRALEVLGAEVVVVTPAETFTGVFSGGFLAEKIFRAIPDGHANDFYKVNFNIIKTIN